MKSLPNIVLALLVLLSMSPVSLAGDSNSPANSQISATVDDTNPVEVELISDKSALVPGQTVNIGVRFKIAPHWHIYHKEPGETGRPTTVDLSLPEGFRTQDLIWKAPETFTDFGLTAHGYTDETLIVIPVTVPDNLKPGDTITITADVTWLACHTNCMPGKATVSLSLPVADTATATNQNLFGSNEDGGSSVFDGEFQLEEDASGFLGFLKIIAFALIGGLILNVMPCVLPVVAFKITGFVKEAGESRSKILRLGLAYAAGTVITCLLLASIVIALQLFGYSVGWGFQFQQPVFVLAMATLVAVMSLGLFGVFMVNVSSGQALNDLSNKEGMVGAFFTGVVATVLATPCSAPFLGTAIGFAFAQPWWGILAIFGAIGLGLASPYVVLSAFPAWTKFLPKPGAWMEHFKQAMGFLLMFSAVWLLHILGKQVGSAGVISALVFIIATSFSAWLIGTFASFNATRSRKIFIWLLAAGVSAGSFWYFTWDTVVYPKVTQASHGSTIQDNGVEWKSFSMDEVDQQLKDGKVVFIDFTATWCGTCQWNKANVLSTDAVGKTFKDHDVQAVRADWTNSDPVITEVLRKFGRSTVPLYVVFSPHRPNTPIILSDLLSEQEVIDAIEAASQK